MVMRPLWILFSVLISAAAVGLYVTSPIDPLQWAAEFIFGAGTLFLPPASPVTRFAEAALAGAIIGYFLIFIPLSIATWLDGGRQSRAFRRALAVAGDDAAADPAARSGGLSSPWWPLLPLYDTERAQTAEGAEPDPLTKTGRTVLIDNLVANQSAASVFHDFPVIAIGLGLIALIGQLLPVLAADPAAAIAGARSGLGSATARGFCSLVAATTAAALFGLMFQLIGAILRRRAGSICAAASLAVRRRKWVFTERAKHQEENGRLLVTPLARRVPERIDGVDDKLIEHVAERVSRMPAVTGRDVAESVESAIRDLHATTLRPMLHDISRLLSLLGDRAGHLVETVDDRLKLQNEHTAQILAATSEIGRALSALPAFGDRAEHLVATVDDRLTTQNENIRQILAATSEIGGTLSALPALGDRADQLIATVDDSLKTHSEHSNQILAATSEIGRALSILSTFSDRAEQLVATVDDRLKTQSEHTGGILAATTEASRVLAVLAERPQSNLATPEGTVSSASAPDLVALQELRQTLNDERGATADVLRGIGRDLAGTLDTALRGTARSIMKPVSAQTEAIRRAAERLDATATAMAHVGTLIEQSSGTIEQKLDRMVAAQETMPAPGGGDAEASRQIQGLAEDVAVVTRAAREALEAIAALSERMKLDQLRAAAAVPAAPSGGLAGWPTMASQPAAAVEKPDAEPRSWAQRISALHRSSVDLTSELPVLETSAVPLVEPVVPLADPLLEDKYLENPALEDKQPS
jgi:hypothetical protein